MFKKFSPKIFPKKAKKYKNSYMIRIPDLISSYMSGVGESSKSSLSPQISF
jgi:hypothetical protein